jgi:hypothetical protein
VAKHCREGISALAPPVSESDLSRYSEALNYRSIFRPAAD